MDITTSAPLLDSRPVAFKPLFSPLASNDTPWFDEGPREANRRPARVEKELADWRTKVDEYNDYLAANRSWLQASSSFVTATSSILDGLYIYLSPLNTDFWLSQASSLLSGTLTQKNLPGIWPGRTMYGGGLTGVPHGMPYVGGMYDFYNQDQTLGNAATWPSGSSFRVEPTESGFDLTGEITVACWFITAEIDQTEHTLMASSGSSGTGWALGVIQQPAGVYNVYFSASITGTQVSSLVAPVNDLLDPYAGGGTTLNKGWHQITLRKRGTLIELFYDGQRIGKTYSIDVTGTPGMSFGALYDGTNPLFGTSTTYPGFYGGYMMDMAFWQKAISDEAIAWLQDHMVYAAADGFKVTAPRPVAAPPASPENGAMNTTSIDPYTQGVEMTRQSQYDAGLVKIWSGEPGHRLLHNRFGMDKNFFPDPGFQDLELFNAGKYLEAQEQESPLFYNMLTFPIITGDNDQLENYYFNGIIEPLTIRPVIAFFSIEAPFESHAVRGTLMGGNTNQINGADRILSVDYFEPTREHIGYLDMVDMIEGHPLNGFFRHEFTSILPFSDERYIRNEPAVNSEPSDMIEAMSHMTGSTDNYIGHNQRSNACGWYYDNNASVGTDSIAFGGMTY